MFMIGHSFCDMVGCIVGLRHTVHMAWFTSKTKQWAAEKSGKFCSPHPLFPGKTYRFLSSPPSLWSIRLQSHDISSRFMGLCCWIINANCQFQWWKVACLTPIILNNFLKPMWHWGLQCFHNPLDKVLTVFILSVQVREAMVGWYLKLPILRCMSWQQHLVKKSKELWRSTWMQWRR